MLTVSDKAAEAIQRVMASAEADVSGLRVMVVSGGCSGLKYKIGFDRTADHGDQVIDVAGYRLFIDSDSSRKLDGASMDYVETVEGAGFVFQNPNAQQNCGCGKSFSC
jgi:iron-sulfur cluster assembly protein